MCLMMLVSLRVFKINYLYMYMERHPVVGGDLIKMDLLPATENSRGFSYAASLFDLNWTERNQLSSFDSFLNVIVNVINNCVFELFVAIEVMTVIDFLF